MSGIKVGTDGMRFQLDVPESEMTEAVKLLDMRGKVLIVTVAIDATTKYGGRLDD